MQNLLQFNLQRLHIVNKNKQGLCFGLRSAVFVGTCLVFLGYENNLTKIDLCCFDTRYTSYMHCKS